MAAEEPRQREDPAASGKNWKQQQGRRSAENLAPRFFALLFALLALYILFSPPSSSLSPPVNPSSTSTSYSVPTSQVIPDKNIAKMSSSEQTFIAIKPDGVQRGLVGPIISRFENRGFKLAAIKLVTPGKEHLEKHYADLAGKPFFPGLIEYMNSGPICAMVWEGRDAVKTGRAILGATNPLASSPGTIRGDYAIDVGRNVCHGSDSVENAQKEIALWFKEGEVVSWKSAQFNWVYEKA
ncbi:nucleoside-diphosphate kinase [Fusarium acutatum]|uniref:Nucleoside diphosphate kinase n=1 Tax=Fusarium acutatum TaxID=78861 RepID=A0A8H4K2T2_9HYPO|nr:nucleoside-diphosphate kinase [Fusarium acutatum]